MRKISVIILALTVLFTFAGCGGKAFIKTQAELQDGEGVVVFSIEVNETFKGDNSLFAGTHADVCSLSVYNEAVESTVSMFPLSDKKFTGPKPWRINKTQKYLILPKGKYVTSTLSFGSSFTFWGLDAIENRTAKKCGHYFTVAPGKVNYWGKCVIDIEFDPVQNEIVILSFTISDNEAKDIAAFKLDNPGLSGLDTVKNTGTRL
jgi:hypothetical protein